MRKPHKNQHIWNNACKDGNLDKLKQLYALPIEDKYHGIFFDTKSNSWHLEISGLKASVEKGYLDVTQFIFNISEYQKILCSSQSMDELIGLAAQHQQVDSLTYLLSLSKPSSSIMSSALAWSIYDNHYDIFIVLYDYNKKENIIDIHYSNNFLLDKIINLNKVDYFSYLINHDFPINEQTLEYLNGDNPQEVIYEEFLNLLSLQDLNQQLENHLEQKIKKIKVKI